jgi:metallo-beta-lactamase class B
MRRAVAAFLLAFAAVCLAAHSRREIWNLPQKPFHIVDDIYYVGTAGLGSYLITSPEGDILLDGGLPESVPQIERHITSLGYKMHDIKYLINSHAHYDHAGGLAELQRASGAKLVASRGDAQNLSSGFQSSYGAGWDSHFPAAHVDRIIENGGTVQVGAVTLTAVLTPGHTKGCTTWTMPVTENGRTYHVVFYCSTSIPGYRLTGNKEYPRIASDYEHSFAVLEKLPCDIFLSNHSEFFDMKEKLAREKPGATNPFIDPGEMHRFVEQSKAEFEAQLRSEHAEKSRAGG